MLIASLALVHALSQRNISATLGAQPIACAPNADISDSGCGNTGIGDSGTGNVGAGNSGTANDGSGNSGLANTGNGNSGSFNVGNGNSGCGNVGVGNSGNGNVAVGASGGSKCAPRSLTVVTAPPAVEVPGGSTLPLTGRNSTEPLAIAMGLMVTGAAAVGFANRRRHVMAAATGGEMIPLSTAVGLLLTGRAKTGDRG